MKLNKLLATLVILFACLVVYGLLTKISVQLGFSKWWQSYVSELVMVFCAIFIFRLWHSNILGIVQFMIQLSSHAKESRYLVPTCARIAVTLWQSVSKFW